MVVIHDVVEAAEQGQGDGKARQTLAAAEKRKPAPGMADQPGETQNRQHKANGNAGRRHRPVAHQHRHQLHHLTAEQEIGRVKRIGEKDLLLPADEGRNERQRRQKHEAIFLAAKQRIDGEEEEQKDRDRRPGRTGGIEKEGDGFRQRIAGDPFDDEDQREESSAEKPMLLSSDESPERPPSSASAGDADGTVTAVSKLATAVSFYKTIAELS